MSHLWKCSRPVGWGSGSLIWWVATTGKWNGMIFKASSNPSHSMIPLFRYVSIFILRYFAPCISKQINHTILLCVTNLFFSPHTCSTFTIKIVPTAFLSLRIPVGSSFLMDAGFYGIVGDHLRSLYSSAKFK